MIGKSAAINGGVNVHDLVGDISDCEEPSVLGCGRNGGGTTVSVGRARRMSCSLCREWDWDCLLL